jgi:hypothetical protein
VLDERDAAASIRSHIEAILGREGLFSLHLADWRKALSAERERHHKGRTPSGQAQWKSRTCGDLGNTLALAR